MSGSLLRKGLSRVRQVIARSRFDMQIVCRFLRFSSAGGARLDPRGATAVLDKKGSRQKCFKGISSTYERGNTIRRRKANSIGTWYLLAGAPGNLPFPMRALRGPIRSTLGG